MNAVELVRVPDDRVSMLRVVTFHGVVVAVIDVVFGFATLAGFETDMSTAVEAVMRVTTLFHSLKIEPTEKEG